ncbi:MAG: AAA family ATPase [Tannerella sp.]|jgi:predicted ATPase|nr:AAA family ATPase [Tannerella sp.]
MKNLPLHIERIFLKDSINCNSEEYPFNLPVIQNFRSLEFRKPVTFLVGENGSGKSTLLEAFAVCYGFNPEGGSKNFNFSTMSSHSSFHECLRITKSYNHAKDGYFLRAESYYNVASEIERLDSEGRGTPIKMSYGGKSLHDQSHGESFWSLLQHRLGGNGVYIFDEPEAALSPMRLLSLLVRIDELVKLNSQFIISTHSPIIMAYPNADIYEITEGKLKLTQFEDTEHFIITKYFVNQYKKLLHELKIDV